MKAKLYAAPTLYPVSLSELKMHLRLDSGTLDDNLTDTQCFAYASHAIQNNYTVHVGTGVDVLGKEAIVQVHHGTNGATGTVDTRIAESDDNVTYTAWTGGSFTQVTTANDNADYKKQYTGTKRYIRTESKVLLAACEFGTSIITNDATTAEDDLLTAILYAAIEQVEDFTHRKLLTQTWDLYLDAWPEEDFFWIPFGNLQSVSSIKWKDEDATETTLTLTTDYLVEDNGAGLGRIVLPADVEWPDDDLYPSNPITVRFVCGWTTVALVPYKIKTAVKMLAAGMWEHREDFVTQVQGNVKDNPIMERLLWETTLWREF
jgi:uncharacterized phiE125 gp8 family phage protein